MTIRYINYFIEHFLFKNLAPVYSDTAVLSTASFKLEDVWDGILNAACPKRKVNKRKVLTKRYGSNYFTSGLKMFQPNKAIKTCSSCGSFHELHTICRECYKKIEEESKLIIENINKSWGFGAVDKEVSVLYQGETAPETKRVVELERPRPLWFSANLSQRAAYPTKALKGPPSEAKSTEVVEKSNI